MRVSLDWMARPHRRTRHELAPAATAPRAEQFKREIPRSTSAIEMPAGKPLWVLTDTGPLAP